MESDNKGLNQDELNIIHTLGQQYNAFSRLDVYHPDDQNDFKDAIHTCQRILMQKAAIRNHPDFFNNHTVNPRLPNGQQEHIPEKEEYHPMAAPLDKFWEQAYPKLKPGYKGQVIITSTPMGGDRYFHDMFLKMGNGSEINFNLKNPNEAGQGLNTNWWQGLREIFDDHLWLQVDGKKFKITYWTKDIRQGMIVVEAPSKDYRGHKGMEYHHAPMKFNAFLIKEEPLNTFTVLGEFMGLSFRESQTSGPEGRQGDLITHFVYDSFEKQKERN